MKKISMILYLIVIFSQGVFSNPINLKKAHQIGKTFLTTSARIPSEMLKSTSNVNYDLVYTAKKNIQNFAIPILNSTESETALFYVFGAKENGYVIVAADDCIIPILGYSDNGTFDPANIPSNMQEWLEGYMAEIQYVIENNIVATEEIQSKWAMLEIGNPNRATENKQSVAPLLKTTWNQDYPYNNLCPMYNSSSRSVTGCVATAMAQIMNYHQYPAQGKGQSEPYTTGSLGINIPSVNYAVNYDWNNMLNTYSSGATTQQQNAVATLMYHCGVSVKMNYGSSSSASSYSISAALTNYFDYDNSIALRNRGNFNNESWENTLKKQIDAGLPVYYSGSAGAGASGHAFICDGYDKNYYFHFNWGWGGSYDGYFLTTALNPGTGGAGAGSGTYNFGQTIIINIKPNKGGVPNYEMALYNEFSTSTSAVLLNGTFSATIRLQNIGEVAFPGGYAGVALVDKDDQIVEIVGNKPIEALSAHNVNPNSFNINCNLSNNIALGSYKLKAVISIDGKTWDNISIAVGCYNSIDFQVVSQLVPVTGITINSSKITLVVDTKEQLTATVLPNNASNNNITWYSSNPGVASVNYNGNISAIDGGTVFIIAKTQDGNFKDTCIVTVVNAYLMSLRQFSVSKLSANPNDTLTASIIVSNLGESTFPGGYVGIAIVDNSEQIVDVIGKNERGSLMNGYYWTNPIKIICTISDIIASGQYKLKAVCRSTNEDWKIINNARNCPVSIDFQIMQISGASYLIDATANPTIGGSVSGGGSYDLNTVQTVTATANTGYTFTNWTENGTVVSTNASYTFTVTANRTLVANFTINCNISASANPSAGGTITGMGAYNHGSSCTLTAIPNAGYYFAFWEENGLLVSTNSVFTFSVFSNHNYVAHFEPEGTLPIKISFKKPVDWTSVNAWVWTGSRDYPVDILSEPFPGVLLQDIGGGWYSYKVNIKYKVINVVFSNGISGGTNQTVDIENITKSSCYNENGTAYNWNFLNDLRKNIKIVDCPTHISKLEESKMDLFNIYPMPVKNQFFAKTQTENSIIKIYAIDGSLVKTIPNYRSNSEINVSTLKTGVYLIKMTGSDGRMYAEKFVKE